jgi:hypothetical protein
VEDSSFELAEPDPAATLTALRSLGYTPQAAVADLIDNSIAAGARAIRIEAQWEGRDSYIRVVDDGRGMDAGELRQAMRPGSKDPLGIRAPHDLGRFGLGLKTASLSQARRLVVASKARTSPAALRVWDLDVVSESRQWRLLKDPGDRSRARLTHSGPGTTVMWEKLDRLVGDADADDRVAHQRFVDILAQIEEHIAMVFHRLLVGPKPLVVLFQGHRVLPWDPFMEDEPATQRIGEETLTVGDRRVRVVPFVLPHHSKLTPDVFKRGAGARGWTPMQGFYVYRNRRLVLPSDWLGLGYQKEVHYQLARIRVDIDNQMDTEWGLDVRKLHARPPAVLRSDFKRIAKIARDRAAEVYRHRGKALARASSQPFAFVWKQQLKHGKVSYRLEREHPLIKDVLEADRSRRKQLEAMLKLIEETVPTAMIALDASENPQDMAPAFSTRSTHETLEVLRAIFDVLLRGGLTTVGAKERLLSMDPFSHYPELVASLGTET